MITVRFFAILRQRLDREGASIEIPSGFTVAQAKRLIGERFASISELLPSAATALNREYVDGAVVLQDGDELALIPPVSGG